MLTLRPPTLHTPAAGWAGRILLAALLLLCPGAAQAGKSVRVQLRFGVEMARQGSWKEAQYRFERALAAAPEDAQILNNLAVAYENNGLYPQAEKTYLQALERSPDNEKIRANYEHFRVFYAERLKALEEQGREGGPTASGDGPRDG